MNTQCSAPNGRQACAEKWGGPASPGAAPGSRVGGGPPHSPVGSPSPRTSCAPIHHASARTACPLKRTLGLNDLGCKSTRIPRQLVSTCSLVKHECCEFNCVHNERAIRKVLKALGDPLLKISRSGTISFPSERRKAGYSEFRATFYIFLFATQWLQLFHKVHLDIYSTNIY